MGTTATCASARELEVEEFLFQLSQGHRDDNILQDALSRLDDEVRDARRQ